jgi:microcystin-dependent protein
MVHQVSGITVPDLSDPASVPSDLATMAADIANLIAAVGQASGAKPAAGLIQPYAGAATPTGYLLCDGKAVSRSTYSLLFAAIGSSYGAGDNSTTFNLPDFRGRALVGYDSTQTEFNTLGKKGGAKSIVQQNNQVGAHAHTTAAHTHRVIGSTAGSGDISGGQGSTADGDGSGPHPFRIGKPSAQKSGGLQGSNHGHPVDITSQTGGGANTGTSPTAQPMTVLNPYATVNYVITTGL